MEPAWKHAREFTRTAVAVDVDLLDSERAERSVAGATRDVSMNGLYLRAERCLPAGARCDVRLYLGGRDSGLCIEAVGRIARLDATGMAVCFEELSYDAYQHLKQLVLLNAPDPDVVLEELAQHQGLRRRLAVC